jgi:hypothetical protein
LCRVFRRAGAEFVAAILRSTPFAFALRGVSFCPCGGLFGEKIIPRIFADCADREPKRRKDD